MLIKTKYGVLHVKLTFKMTLIFYINSVDYFKSYFCRPCMPMSVILSYLAKIFLMFAILTKTVFCLQFLRLERPPFSYMNSAPCFYFLFSQTICIYVTSLRETKNSSTEVTLMFLIMINNDVLGVMLTFEMTLFSFMTDNPFLFIVSQIKLSTEVTLMFAIMIKMVFYM